MTMLMALLQIDLPQDPRTNVMMLLRFLHFAGGITWIGLLYFFNLINVPFMKGLEAPTRSRIYSPLMSRALWWFRWGSVVTVLAGFIYWAMIVAADARNASASGGHAMMTFFLIWTVAFVIEMGILMSPSDALRKPVVLGIIVAVVVCAAAWIFVSLNSHGWESNRMLSIGVGGGMGWFMMLNVWGVIWRMQKRIIGWNEQNAANGTPILPESAKLARLAFLASRVNFGLSFPMLFFMGAASHYTLFGNIG